MDAAMHTPADEYQRLAATSTDAADATLADAARAADAAAPRMPAALARAMLDGALHPLAAWRRAAGMKAAELARRAGVRAATVSDIERGRIDPRFGTVRALADVLGVDTDDIMP
jgi:DNA-binding XRE family transcriptional regulator